MARYGVSHYGSSLYGAPLLSVFSADPFTATATDYGAVYLKWTSPGGNWDSLRLIRSYYGYPITEVNGTQVYSASTGADVAEFHDSGLLTDRWVYYSIFVHDPSQDLWIRSGVARAYSVRSYGGPARMFDLVPAVGQSEPLERFMGTFGLAYDALRNDANSLLDLYDADTVLYDLVPVVMSQFGIPPETELEPEQYRRFLRNAVHFYKTKGTSECVHGVTTAVTGWPCVVAVGDNLLWDADFSDFVGSIAYWGRGSANCTMSWTAPTTDGQGNAIPGALRMTSTLAGSISASFISGSVDDLHRFGINVVHGISYSLGGLVRASDLAQSGAHLDIAWYDLTGTLISVSVGPSAATRQGVDTVVKNEGVIAPTNAVWAVPLLVVDNTVLGSYWEWRTLMFNRGTNLIAHQPGRDIRIYLDITDTDVLRIAVHIARLRAILPRYLPFGATFTLVQGLPTTGVVVSDDTILVDYEPPPATAPVGTSITLRWNVTVDDAVVVNLRWNQRQTVGAQVALRWNVYAGSPTAPYGGGAYSAETY